MTIKMKSSGVFDVEYVCPGDLLERKDNKRVYFVVNVDLDTEEFIVVEKVTGSLSVAIGRLGFEKIDDYNKIKVYDAASE